MTSKVVTLCLALLAAASPFVGGDASPTAPHPLADRLAGTWGLDAALTERLAGEALDPAALEIPGFTLTVDPAALDELTWEPSDEHPALASGRVRGHGTDGVFVLTTHDHVPTLLTFAPGDSDATAIAWVPGAARELDLLFLYPSSGADHHAFALKRVE